MEDNTLSPTYRTAYEDLDFIGRDELRPLRLMTELLKPTMTFEDHSIQSTICVFGSARTKCPTTAQVNLNKIVDKIEVEGETEELLAELQKAKSDIDSSKYYALAREFSAIVSRFGQTTGALEYVICTGGGPGIMEAANRGAHDVGAKSIGLNITLPHEQSCNPYISPELNFLFHYFSMRKMMFLLDAKALCAFPGGYGTLDELFETLTLIQTGKAPKMPVILFGVEFWKRMVDWDYLSDQGMISPEDLDLFHLTDDPKEGFDLILKFWSEKEG
ncbi:MAG: TIGR00730 family Rossman fold protein [Lentisphaeria bacterium]|nr:TIGR00730 family Rossman fold protein [Lentisphaeria bacterium]